MIACLCAKHTDCCSYKRENPRVKLPRILAASVFAITCACLLVLGERIGECLLPQQTNKSQLSSSTPKKISFAIREDYEKGDDLRAIAEDLALCKELGIGEMFVNIGWDDYEPRPDRFDFAWLHDFVDLAAEHGIKLRPYICYKPWWEGDGRWNSPPSDFQQWRDFCTTLGAEMKRHPNILSFEIWLEENAEMWWRGSGEQYKTLLEHASEALRAANPHWQIALGGFTHPDRWFLAECTEGDFERHYDVVPLHCYNETWADEPLEEYFNPTYTGPFLLILDSQGGGEPLWMSECGYSTLGRTEEEQANYIARAVPYFLADPASDNRFVLFTYYELKDLPEGSQMIGDEHNYHFGLCRADRTKKLSFHAYDMLTDLLDGRTVTPADCEATVEATEGCLGELHHHLLRRSDGVQVLFVYDKENTAVCSVTLTVPGKKCTKWNLDGTAEVWGDFDGTVVSNIALAPGQVWIFEIK